MPPTRRSAPRSDSCFSLMAVTVSCRSWKTRWLSCRSASPAGVMRMRRPMRWKTVSPSSSSSSRICRVVADCETSSFSPAAVNEPVSAMARMISSCRKSTSEAYINDTHRHNTIDENFAVRGWEGARVRSSRFDACDRFREIPFVHLDAHEVQAALRAGAGRRSETEERIRDRPDAIDTVQAEAHLGKAGRKRGRMRPILVPALDGVVGNEPRVAAAAKIVGRGAPAADVRLVLIPHTDRLAAERRLALRCEMEHELVAVVQEPFAVDRLVVADGEILFEP